MAQGASRSSKQPATPAGRALQKRHLRENIAYNRAHRDEHDKQAKADEKALKKASKNRVKQAKK